jgi:predicted PurR-regulated permease PerM
MQQGHTFDLPRAMMQVLALGALIFSALWLVSPFLAPLAWAATIVIATWPLLLHAQDLLGGRRGAAATLMTLALLLLVVAPLATGITALVGNTDQIVEWSKSLATMTVPQPPGWLVSLPMVGAKIGGRWQEIASLTPDQLAERLAPYGQSLALWTVHQVGSIGLLLVQFLLMVVIAAILYTNGEGAAAFAVRFARRLAGDQGEESMVLAASAIRGVALGVIVTAVLQTSLCGVGLVIAGVPFASILLAAIFVLCVAQVGPHLVMLPATFWVWSTAGKTWGIAFLIWSIACGVMDNFVRPVLIRRGADLPLLLIFTGVIGGLLAMGVIGLFLGPVVLAVGYTLLQEWVAEKGPDDSPDAG